MKKKLVRLLGPLVVLVIFSVAAVLLSRQLKHYDFQEILRSVHETPWTHIVVAVALTILNYTILVGYDLMAVRYVGERLALWRVALASFCGYAFSYNFGATLAGTTIRYRLYSAWQLPVVKILQLLVILGLTFWFGVFALAGMVFVFAPLRIPPERMAELTEGFTDYLSPGVINIFEFLFSDSRPFGIVLLAIALGYLGLSAWHRGSIKILRWQLPVPPFKLSLYQVGIASADMLVAAWVLYMLFPVTKGGYLAVLGIYLVAYVVVVLSHVPGGVGVFELLILELCEHLELVPMPDGKNEQLAAALLIFRIVYFWVPLLIAGVLLAGHEVVLGRHWLRALLRALGRQPPDVEHHPDATRVETKDRRKTRI